MSADWSYPAGQYLPAEHDMHAASYDAMSYAGPSVPSHTGYEDVQAAHTQSDTGYAHGTPYGYTHGAAAYNPAYATYHELANPHPASHGAAGFPYAAPVPVPAHPPASTAPAQPYSAKQNTGGYAVAAPMEGAPFAQAHMYEPYAQPQEFASFAPAGYAGAFHRHHPLIVPSHTRRESESSLQNALGPAQTRAMAPSRRHSDLVHPSAMMRPVPSQAQAQAPAEYRGVNLEAHGSPYSDDQDYQFVLETGSPASASSSRSAHERARLSAADDLARKQARAARTPKKEQGFLACFFCRGRKIACNAPAKDAADKRCEQCVKRNIDCEFPTVSRRGQRNVEGKRKPQDEEQYASKRARSEGLHVIQPYAA